jgi:hypothetical protein
MPICGQPNLRLGQKHPSPGRHRQMRTNQLRDFSQSLGRNLNSLSTLCIPAWIVWGASFASGAIECRELRRAYTPITALLPGHNVEMEVRRFLSTEDPVVLERKYPEGAISLDERLCDSLGRDQYRRTLLAGKIEQRRDVPACDDAALTHFELPRIDHGQRMFAFVYDLPPLFPSGQAEIARISYGEFDHLRLRLGYFLKATQA